MSVTGVIEMMTVATVEVEAEVEVVTTLALDQKEVTEVDLS